MKGPAMKSINVPLQTNDLPACHWLLDAVYGRGLLMLKLRTQKPEIRVPIWREALELDPLLDQMIDEMGLRHWPRPVGVKARLDYLKTVLRMRVAVPR